MGKLSENGVGGCEDDNTNAQNQHEIEPSEAIVDQIIHALSNERLQEALDLKKHLPPEYDLGAHSGYKEAIRQSLLASLKHVDGCFSLQNAIRVCVDLAEPIGLDVTDQIREGFIHCAKGGRGDYALQICKSFPNVVSDVYSMELLEECEHIAHSVRFVRKEMSWVITGKKDA